jgi:hypothetical protein
MINIFAGIIIEEFIELRNKEHKKLNDMHDTCFICGLKR